MAQPDLKRFSNLRAGTQKFFETWFENDILRLSTIVLVIVVLSSLSVFFFEHGFNKLYESPIDALWWSFVTITTTGYGDKYPITLGGRLVAVAVMFAGIILLSIISGTVSSTLVARKIREGQGLQEITLKRHILLCGWSSTAETILLTLRESALDTPDIVLINDLAEEQISNLIYRFKDLNLKFVRGSFTDEEVLARANARDAFAAIVLPDTSGTQQGKADERTLLATLALKSLNPKIKLFAHVLEQASAAPIRRANADGLVTTDQHIGFMLANHVLSPGVPDVIDDLTSYKHGAEIRRIPIPPDFIGSRFIDLFVQLRADKKGLLIGVITEETSLGVADILGSDSDSYLDAFIRQRFTESGKKISKEKTAINLNPADDYEIQAKDFAIVIYNR
ncbi:MAG: NAD-binding protein [Rhizobacter sp.]|nr:NAD-binding protein [Chlorobiales bacterium]